MSDIVVDNKANEITINLRKLIVGCKSNRKASSAVRRLKKFIQKQFNSTDNVYIHPDVNMRIFSRGNKGCVGRIRILVQKCTDFYNKDKTCFSISSKPVASFKSLKDIAIERTEDNQ
ncbi:RL31 [Hepatospora eriocheir]|uniref:RL31 n=1 Tax=Hepatospora eriocheir TaxID=1081669 RepID=A0A1X0QH91_9MICR|nr:RL31 [Hepatospora eriocheir]